MSYKFLLAVIFLFLTLPNLTPTWLIIPAINLSSPIVPVGREEFTVAPGVIGFRWATDDTRVGWHSASARLFEPDNMVLNGHSNRGGMVFHNLNELTVGERITVYAGGLHKDYVISRILIVKENGESLERRVENARLIEPTGSEQVTLITCAPDGYRLIVIAK